MSKVENNTKLSDKLIDTFLIVHLLHRFSDHLAVMFGSEGHPVPWDSDTKYKPESIQVTNLFSLPLPPPPPQICPLFLKGVRCSSVVRAFAHGCDGSSDRSFMVDSLS